MFVLMLIYSSLLIYEHIIKYVHVDGWAVSSHQILLVGYMRVCISREMYVAIGTCLICLSIALSLPGSKF